MLIHASDAGAAFFSPETGVDWNVIFLLLGMMVIVGVLKQTGIFEYLAIWAAKRAKGRPFRLMVLLVVITALASALLDNVTTVLLIAPVTFLVQANGGNDHAQVCGGRWPSAPTWAATPPPSAPPPTWSSSASPPATAPDQFWEFTKYGLIVAFVTVALVTPYLWLRYLI